MLISRVEVYRYTIAWAHGRYGMSGGRDHAEGHASLVVQVLTDDGVEGWAETSPHGRTYLPSFVEAELAALKVLGQAVLGLDPRNLGALNAVMDAELRGGAPAKAALDVACWDLFGHSAGLSVSALLGGRLQETVPLFVAVPTGTLDESVAHAERDLAAGVRVFQVKVGDDPLEDVRRVRAVLEVVGDDCVVIADANGGWQLGEALVAARALEGSHVRLEQPCATISECAELRRHTALPLVLDETVCTMDDLVRARREAGATGVNLKTSRLGGMTRLRALRDAATGLGMTFTVDDTWGGVLTTAQNAHLAASSDPRHLTATTWFADWVEPLVGTVLRSVSGRGIVPDAPGLGVEVDRSLFGPPVWTTAA